MDPWRRFRLLACLALMLALLGAGGVALVRWGVPKEPYGIAVRQRRDYHGVQWPRRPNVWLELEQEYDYQHAIDPIE